MTGICFLTPNAAAQTCPCANLTITTSADACGGVVITPSCKGGTSNYSVDWGDGTTCIFCVDANGNYKHQYAHTGTFTVTASLPCSEGVKTFYPTFVVTSVPLTPSCTVNLGDKTIGSSCSNSVTYFSQTGLPSFMGFGTYHVYGKLIIDQIVSFFGAELAMEPGAEIVVQSGSSLSLFSCNTHGCTQMWKGITNNGVVNLSYGNINDALYAVSSSGSANLTLSTIAFNNNYIGFYVPPSFNPLFFQTPGFYNGNGVIFNGGNLKPCYPGQPAFTDPGGLTSTCGQSFAGIYWNQCTYINVGSIYATTYFSNLNTGVYLNNSGPYITVSNTIMNNVVNGVIGLNSIFTTSIFSNTINATTNGIWGNQENFNVYNNTINADVNGILMQNLSSPFTAKTNTIGVLTKTAFPPYFNAISISAIQSNTNSDILIDGNIINLPANETGIGVVGYNGANKTTIQNNTITRTSESRNNGGIGLSIFLQNLINTVVYNNNMYVNSTINSLSAGGVWFNACQQNYLNYNNINNYSSNAFTFYGATLWNTSNNTICSNNFLSTRYGLDFNGGGSNTIIFGNSFANHTYDLNVLNANFYQHNHGNIWGAGSFYTAYANVPDPLAFVNNSSFCDNAPGNIYPPLFFVPTCPPGALPDARNCSKPGVMAVMAGATISVTASDGDMAIARDTILNNPLTKCLKWLDQRALLSKLSATPSLLSNPAIASFATKSASANIGKQHQIGQSLAALYEIDATASGQLNGLAAVLSVADSLGRLLETQIKKANKTDSSSLRSSQIKIYSDALPKAIQYRQITETQRLKRIKSVSQLIQSNEAIVAIEPYEKDEQSIHRLYLNTIAQGVFTFSAAQKQEIDRISAQCPFLSGNAVFFARSLQSTYKTLFYDDKKNCDGQIATKIKTVSDNRTQSFINSIYPNPTTGGFTLELGTPFDNDGRLNLFDITGKQTGSFLIKAGETHFDMDVSDLSYGIYICRLFEGNHAVWSQKLVIVKK